MHSLFDCSVGICQHFLHEWPLLLVFTMHVGVTNNSYITKLIHCNTLLVGTGVHAEGVNSVC